MRQEDFPLKTTDITDEQIEILAQEAGQAGDMALVAICRRALNHFVDWRLLRDSEKRIAVRYMSSTEDARAECAQRRQDEKTSYRRRG